VRAERRHGHIPHRNNDFQPRLYGSSVLSRYAPASPGSQSQVHRDLVFLICLVSFHKYQLSNLIPYFIFPVYLVSAGDIPGRHILKKILAVSPFAFMMAVFNPVFDTNVVGHIGIWSVTGGWISFCSIMLRFVLTVGTVFCLIACTGFHALCNAMGRLGMPRGLVVQLLFLYRLFSSLWRRRPG
jgi:cobalt/nickel transport system permease protein